MSARWIIVGIMLLFASAIAIALLVSVVRDVEADRLDAGGRRRGRRRGGRKGIDLFKKDRPEV